MTRKIIGRLLVVLLFGSFVASGDDVPGNLLRNPGFEDGDFPPPHWQRNTTAMKLPSFGGYDTEVKHGGKRALKIVRAPDQQHTYWFQQDIKVEPETDYVFGGWIKVQDVKGDMGAFLHVFAFPKGTNNHADRLFAVQLPYVKDTQDWKEFKKVLRTTVATDHLTFFAQFSKCSGECWFDDFYLRPAKQDEAGLSPPWAREEGTVMWQSFDDVVDGKFADVTPRQVKGLLRGKDVKPTKEGRHGGAIEFTGPDGYVTFDSQGAGDNATTECWIYRRKQKEVQRHGEVIIRCGKTDFRIGHMDRNPDLFVLLRPTDWKAVLVSKSPIPFDEWTHVAVTYEKDHKRSRIYINGQLDAEGTQYEFESFSGGVSLCTNTPAHRFIGKLDEVAVFNRAKSPEEICRDVSRSEPIFIADNGVLKLSFEQTGPLFLNVFTGGRWVGSLGGVLAQFEKKGIGYKKAGVGCAFPTRVKGVDVKKRDDAECIADVTLERTQSLEMERKFEATWRITFHADRSWFEARLVSVKNTDGIDYELRGYCHILLPKSGAMTPRSYGRIGGWIGGTPSIGAINRGPDDFTLGFRKAEDKIGGEITRRLSVPMEPGFTWTGDEPGLILFIAPTADEKGFYRAALDIVKEFEEGAGQPPKGKITYKEEQPKSKPKPK